MREVSGIIINDDIFINSSHVVKIVKEKNGDEYIITIHLSESAMSSAMPVVLTFDSEIECAAAYKKIINDMYGFNYAITNLNTKSK